MFDQIEKLKQEYTDKYVIVDASFPELARFEGQVGQVRTVNMSGRALVEFDCWANIGWYDIEVDYLKVVPKPEPKVASEKPAKSEAPAPVAAKAPAAAAGGKKLSPLEMARMQGAAKPAGAPSAEKTAAAPADGGAKKSTADILAAARAKKAAEAASEPAETQIPESSPAATAAKPAASMPAAMVKGERPSLSEILAWCREHDAH